eukprot:g2150.t1
MSTRVRNGAPVSPIAVTMTVSRGETVFTATMVITRGTAGRTEASALPRKRKRTTRRGCRDDDSPTEEEVSGPDACPPDEQQPWDVIIVDEGHQIKNPSCQFGRALRRINARSRILLTGTPLQNKLGDLWALMDFVQPGLLGNHATFDRPHLARLTCALLSRLGSEEFLRADCERFQKERITFRS